MTPSRWFARALPLVTAAAAALAGVAAPRVAHAQVEIHLSSKPADPKKPGAPMIQATVINGPAGVPADKFSLIESDAKPAPVTIKAKDVKTYTEGTETLAVAVLIEGHGLWMGNPDFSDAPGVLPKLGGALDAVAKAGPPGSKGELIIYAQEPQVKVPMGDLTQLNSGLGAAKDFKATTRELVAGVNQAYADLSKVTSARKALIVIGDGSDTNAEAAKAQLADLKKKFDAAKIDVYGVFYQVESLEGDPSVIRKLIPNIKIANSMDNISAQVSAIVETIDNRLYVTFPGYDDKLKAGFTWDGKEHAFTLKIDQDENDAGTLTMVPKWAPPGGGGFRWWLWFLVLPIGLIALVVVGAKLFGGKKPAPPPMVVAAPPPPAPAAPAPAAPMKTVMLGIGGSGDDGFPIVGWLVPLNGPNQFQTFKLQGGATIIGTGGKAHVVINDGFMSTEHAQIIASPDGFTLKDNGSTNGIFVNEHKADTHMLVDNDVILMGKTNFKFKSTV